MGDIPQIISARTPRLRRHLSLVIALKILALTALWWFFFRDELRPPADSASVATQMLGDRILNSRTPAAQNSGTTIPDTTIPDTTTPNTTIPNTTTSGTQLSR